MYKTTSYSIHQSGTNWILKGLCDHNNEDWTTGINKLILIDCSLIYSDYYDKDLQSHFSCLKRIYKCVNYSFEHNPPTSPTFTWNVVGGGARNISGVSTFTSPTFTCNVVGGEPATLVMCHQPSPLRRSRVMLLTGSL